MKFKYNGRIYNPVNVEKKLKKMGITMEDIEILPDEKKKESSTEIEDYMLNKKQMIVRSTQDDIRRIVYVDKDKPLPTMSELFKNQMWNSKTGIKGLTREYLMTMYYE